MEKNESLPLGVVIEWRRVDHPWKDHSWLPVAVFAGAPEIDSEGPWTRLRDGEGWVQYHCGTLALQLFRADTEGYKVNLGQTPPRVFVVLRDNDDPQGAHDLLPFLVTANPYEAQHYLDNGEDIVETVSMPEDVIAFVQAFVDANHVEAAFTKRKRDKAKPQDESFSRIAPVERPRSPTSGRGPGRG
ncbi:MAG: DUF3305 domain-containing protein [Kiloniellaceae bacterium]